VNKVEGKKQPTVFARGNCTIGPKSDRTKRLVFNATFGSASHGTIATQMREGKSMGGLESIAAENRKSGSPGKTPFTKKQSASKGKEVRAKLLKKNGG